MARMIPADPPDAGSPGGKAEAVVFHALDRCLGPEYTIFHHRPFFDPTTADAGELDFLVVHRDRGLLYIEVKGRSVQRKRDGHWYRGDEPAQNPFEQVIRHAHEFTEALREGWQRVGNGSPFPFVYGYAVAFPFTPIDAIKNCVDSPEELIIASEDFRNLGDHIPNLMDFWKGKRRPYPQPPISDAEYKKFIDHVLNPKLGFDPTLGAGLAREGESIDYNTSRQDLFFNCFVQLTAEPNLRKKVKGGAGTGKTRLCLELARHHASIGKHVLLLCYNVYLATWLRQQITSSCGGGAVDVWHFDGLCEEAIRKAGREPLDDVAAQPHDTLQRYFRHQLPYELWTAADCDLLGKWDLVLIDEAQDFPPLYLIVLEKCICAGGSVVAFHDPQQDIFRSSATRPDLYHPLFDEYTPLPDLQINLRNSKRIVRWLQQNLACDVSQAHDQSPEGDASPERRLQSAGDKGRSEIEALVRELTGGRNRIRPEQICILSLASKDSRALHGVSELAGFRLTENPFDREGMILATSARKYKGLESDVVIVIDVDPQQNDELQPHRLVACSRARHLLYVFEKQPA